MIKLTKRPKTWDIRKERKFAFLPVRIKKVEPNGDIYDGVVWLQFYYQIAEYFGGFWRLVHNELP